MNIDFDDSLKLLAICVALGAYISNVRRDMVTRYTSLKEGIDEKLPLQLKKNEITQDEMVERIQAKQLKQAKIKSKIVKLMWGDIPLVLASLAILSHWAVQYIVPGCSVFLDVAKILFGFAVIALAYQHFKEWRK